MTRSDPPYRPMEPLPDYYRILEVPANASVEMICHAYQRLARVHHPSQGGKHAELVKLNEAFGMLSHELSRHWYDQALAKPGDNRLEADLRLMARSQAQRAATYPENYKRFLTWLETACLLASHRMPLGLAGKIGFLAGKFLVQFYKRRWLRFPHSEAEEVAQAESPPPPARKPRSRKRTRT